MPDLSLEWGGDFQISATGDLLLADGDDFARQRLQRRLFTAVQGYIWAKEYGAGLPQKIGSTYQATQIQAIVMSQLAMETAVAANPPPRVAVTAATGIAGLISIDISYTDAQTGAAISFTVSV